jgi:hypothetical protein
LVLETATKLTLSEINFFISCIFFCISMKFSFN